MGDLLIPLKGIAECIEREHKIAPKMLNIKHFCTDNTLIRQKRWAFCQLANLESK